MTAFSSAAVKAGKELPTSIASDPAVCRPIATVKTKSAPAMIENSAGIAPIQLTPRYKAKAPNKRPVMKDKTYQIRFTGSATRLTLRNQEIPTIRVSAAAET